MADESEIAAMMQPRVTNRWCWHRRYWRWSRGARHTKQWPVTLPLHAASHSLGVPVDRPWRMMHCWSAAFAGGW